MMSFRPNLVRAGGPRMMNTAMPVAGPIVATPPVATTPVATTPPGAQYLYCTPAPAPAETPATTPVANTGRLAPSLAAFAPTTTWRSNLFKPQDLTSTGQLATAAGDAWTFLASSLGLIGTGLGAYHGYRRTGSVGWTIAWALLGGLFPIITIPVAFAQGFGRPEPSFRQARVSGR